MNIKDYILANGLPHKMINGIMYQTEFLYLSNKGITSLNGFVQNGALDLSYNQIKSLKGFIQNGYLNLRNNKITSLKGFIQNNALDLSYNKITTVEEFVQNEILELKFNLIKNTKNVFVNPQTNRVVIYNPKFKTYSCGCFYQKSEREFVEKCKSRGFTEILKHFNLI